MPEPESLPAFRFGLRAVFGLMWLIACFLAGLQQGGLVTVAVAAPLGVVGFLLFTGRRSPFSAVVMRAAVASTLPCLLLAIATIWINRPANLATWLAVFGGVAWSLVFVLVAGLRWLFPLPVAMQTLLLWHCIDSWAAEQFLPIRGAGIQDLRGGYKGMMVEGFQFMRPGANLRLLERYIDPQRPEWTWEGDERVLSKSIIWRESLPKALALLPHDAARRQVLQALTEPDNRMRVHQSMLLACLGHLGHSPGYTAETWWNAHEWAFRIERDPKQAAQAVQGWTAKVEALQLPNDEVADEIRAQIRAARYQERGTKGGDREFSDAYMRLPSKGIAPFRMEHHTIAWWPPGESRTGGM